MKRFFKNYYALLISITLISFSLFSIGHNAALKKRREDERKLMDMVDTLTIPMITNYQAFTLTIPKLSPQVEGLYDLRSEWKAELDPHKKRQIEEYVIDLTEGCDLSKLPKDLQEFIIYLRALYTA